jgi:hypothetical protein
MSTVNAKQFFYVTDEQVKDLKDKFALLVRKLGAKNTKGTDRYKFEVDFAYAIDAFDNGPKYFKSKLFEQANAVVNALTAKVKSIDTKAT